ncbi:iron ABC transporter permease, partial [Citrobacter braakii]
MAVVWLVCGLPVLLGFGLPVLFMLRPLVQGGDVLPWQAFAGWARNSVTLAGTAAGLTTVAALVLGYAVRRLATPLVQGAVRVVALGYA